MDHLQCPRSEAAPLFVAHTELWHPQCLPQKGRSSEHQKLRFPQRSVREKVLEPFFRDDHNGSPCVQLWVSWCIIYNQGYSIGGIVPPPTVWSVKWKIPPGYSLSPSESGSPIVAWLWSVDAGLFLYVWRLLGDRQSIQHLQICTLWLRDVRLQLSTTITWSASMGNSIYCAVSVPFRDLESLVPPFQQRDQ